jgi:hypothetical protein
MGFIMDTPLLSLLEFQEKMAPMPMPAAEQVDGLLRQVHGSDGRHA